MSASSLSGAVHDACTVEYGSPAPDFVQLSPGVWSAPGTRIIDRSGRKMLPIGRDGFVPAVEGSVVIDKTLLIADVLNSGCAVTLFCRPRRFGKTLNMTMMKSFFELAQDSGCDPETLFEGTEIWEADGGRYRREAGAHPVVYINLNTVKRATWEESYGAIKALVIDEYARHAYLQGSPSISQVQRSLFERIVCGAADETDIAVSLSALCQMLKAHHSKRAVLIIDEYDAPVMAGLSAANGGYYDDVVGFMKAWLTGALKGGGDFLEFACLTGVQRISKESIFSDLNNVSVSTSLECEFSERFGFTDAEVAALASYLGHGDCIEEARAWYDGYRFGSAFIYNPWSVLNYFNRGCLAQLYWSNTSGNAVLGDLIATADDATLADLYRLCEPGGTVWSNLDLGIVFPDVAGRQVDAVWSMLYLAGYLTTDDPEHVGEAIADPYPLRIPNREILFLFRGEIVSRFAGVAGGTDALRRLHTALVSGDCDSLARFLGAVVGGSTSYHDITSENSAHMLLLGLCYGVAGYEAPQSNLESGRGRFDIRLVPSSRSTSAFSQGSARPLVTIELKFLPNAALLAPNVLSAKLEELARAGLEQIRQRGYDEGPLPSAASGRLRWGIAFGGKSVACVCERV